MSDPSRSPRVRRRPKTLFGALALAVTIVVLTATPASAHAQLLTTNPTADSVVPVAPKQLELTFGESVEVSFGSIAVFDQKGNPVDIGAPHHAKSSDRTVDVSLPHLGVGAYVVTWRVISADSHPVHGAFTFVVGHSSGNATGLAAKLEAKSGGSKTVGALFAISRAVLFAGIALMIGATVFAASIRPQGRRRSRADALVLTGWVVLLVSTLVALLLQGPYAGALPLSEITHVAVLRNVLKTRYGHLAEIRIVLLLAMLPLLLWIRRSWRPNPWWWALAVPLGLVISATPGLAGHAATGTFTQLAIPIDALHVTAMSIWLGGLAALALVVLDRDPDAERAAARFSPVALTSVVVIVGSGLFASWRQVGFTLDAYTHTTYGRLLLVKIGTFIVLLALAAWSRTVVRARRAATLRAIAEAAASNPPHTPTVEPEGRSLRWSVWGELVFGIAVLTITALLVNAQPARGALSLPYTKEFREPTMSVDLIISPAKAGPVEIHVYTLSPAGSNLFTPGVTAEISLPSKHIQGIEVPMKRAGVSHFLACTGHVSINASTQTATCASPFAIPYPGKWHIVIRALRNEFDEVAVQADVTIR